LKKKRAEVVMSQWIVEQVVKLLLALCLSGITWVAVVGLAGMTVPFWLIFVAWVLIVFFAVWYADLEL